MYSVPGQGVTLTPFYDLMCMRIYPGLSPDLVFALGGEVRPGEMGSEHLRRMAGEPGMQPRFPARRAAELAARVPDATARAVRDLTPAMTPSARTLAARLERFVSTSARKLGARLAT